MGSLCLKPCSGRFCPRNPYDKAKSEHERACSETATQRQLITELAAILKVEPHVNSGYGTAHFQSQHHEGYGEIEASYCTFSVKISSISFDLAKAIAQAIQMIPRLVRDSATVKPATAESGFFQKTLDSNHPCQLVRVAVDKTTPYYAEISGGRHRFTVRFLEFSNKDGHVRQTSNTIDFKLECCVI